MTEDAMSGQVGGTHYKDMGMQPFEFTMANRYDPLAHTINKYVARHRSKGGKQDLEKAIHCVKMRLQLLGEDRPACLDVITVLHYCRANALPDRETAILRNLHYWVIRANDVGFGGFTDEEMCQALVKQIGWLIATDYENKEPNE